MLPFPPLDGGRIAVVLIEAVRRRRLPAEREALVYLTGFMVLIVLVILISIQRRRANLIGRLAPPASLPSGLAGMAVVDCYTPGGFAAFASGPNRY